MVQMVLAIGLSGQRKTGGRYPVGDNMWRHLAVTLSEKQHSGGFHSDGYKEQLHYKNIDFSNFSIDTRSSDLVLGGDSFYGMIDDVRIYSDLLNPVKLRIYQESSLEDLNLYNSDYTLSVWVKPDDLPASNKYGFATGRFYWETGDSCQSGHRTKSGEIFNSTQVARNWVNYFRTRLIFICLRPQTSKMDPKLWADNWGNWWSRTRGFLRVPAIIPSLWEFSCDPDGEPALGLSGHTQQRIEYFLLIPEHWIHRNMATRCFYGTGKSEHWQFSGPRTVLFLRGRRRMVDLLVGSKSRSWMGNIPWTHHP